MKKLFLFAAITFALASCQKENIEPAPAEPTPAPVPTTVTKAFKLNGSFYANDGVAHFFDANGNQLEGCFIYTGTSPIDYVTLEVGFEYHLKMYENGTPSPHFDGTIQFNSDGSFVANNNAGSASLAVATYASWTFIQLNP